MAEVARYKAEIENFEKVKSAILWRRLRYLNNWFDWYDTRMNGRPPSGKYAQIENHQEERSEIKYELLRRVIYGPTIGPFWGYPD